MAGILEGFAQGFFNTSASTILKQKADQEEIDNARKRAIALIDPTVEVKRRENELQLEQDKQKQKNNFEGIKNYLNPSTPTLQDAPTGTQDVATKGFTSTNSPVTNSIETVFADLQKYTEAKAKAEAAGNKQAADYLGTLADGKKQQLDYLKTQNTTGNKPVVGSEGVNIVEGIQKKLDSDLKNPGAISEYFPDNLNILVNNPTAKPIHEKLAIQHQELAQAVASVKRDNMDTSIPEVASKIQDETSSVIKNLNIINLTDKRITPEMKKQAAIDIDSYMSTLPIKVAADPNFKAVFTSNVSKKIESYLHPTETQSTPTAAPIKHMDLSSPEALKIRADFKSGKIDKATAQRLLRQGN